MRSLVLISVGFLVASAASGQVLQYGDADLLGTGTWSTDPKTGATLTGLAPGVSTFSSHIQGHGFPFDPSVGEYPGTDQIYVGSNQTGFSDGYSSHAGRKAGPQVITMDYASLIDGSVETLTLGICADDFQRPAFGNPFTALINGEVYQPLTDILNGLSQTGPTAQFFTIGLPVGLLSKDNVLTLSIDEGGSGGDGWAIDFLTVGVTNVVPTPGAIGLLAVLPMMSRRKR